MGIVIPLHKQDNVNVHDTNNYRGITLLSILSKIFLDIINGRLVFWAESLKKIDEAQVAFREGYSTVDNVFVLHSVIQHYVSSKGGKHYALL